MTTFSILKKYQFLRRNVHVGLTVSLHVHVPEIEKDTYQINSQLIISIHIIIIHMHLQKYKKVKIRVGY